MDCTYIVCDESKQPQTVIRHYRSVSFASYYLATADTFRLDMLVLVLVSSNCVIVPPPVLLIVVTNRIAFFLTISYTVTTCYVHMYASKQCTATVVSTAPTVYIGSY